MEFQECLIKDSSQLQGRTKSRQKKMQQIGRLLEVSGMAAPTLAPRHRPLFARPGLSAIRRSTGKYYLNLRPVRTTLVILNIYLIYSSYVRFSSKKKNIVHL